MAVFPRSITLLMWGVRFFFFTLYESPKYLMGKGEDDGAVAVLRNVARVNGKKGSVTLTPGDLTRVYVSESAMEGGLVLSGSGDLREVVLQKLGVVDANHVKPLFATRKLAWSTGLLIVLWDKFFAYRLYFLTHGIHN
jgi:hypothetical protein